MIKNYLKIALRNIFRDRTHSIINILGLSVGLTGVILITLFLRHELSFDRFYPNHENTYRVEVTIQFYDMTINTTSSPSQMARDLPRELPEVQKACKVEPVEVKVIQKDEVRLAQKDLVYTDESFLEMFPQQFLQGDPQTALKNPKSLVIDETTAKKLLGKTNVDLPLAVQLDNQSFTLTGIIRDVPDNTHLPFSGLVFESPGYFPKEWDSFQGTTYFQLKEGQTQEGFAPKFQAFLEDHQSPESLEREEFKLYKIADIHLNSNFGMFMAGLSGTNRVYLLSLISLFIILIASINYINLATARSTNRAKEIGIRKVLGSSRRQLLVQFLTESVLLAGIALLISLGISELLKYNFGLLVDKDLSASYWDSPYLLLILGAMSLGVGLLSGIYPALILSAYKPVKVLKGKMSRSRKGVGIRKALVVFQFVISMLMISSTWVIFLQMTYVKNFDLGFNQNHLMVLEVPSASQSKIPLIEKGLSESPFISSVATVSTPPAKGQSMIPMWFDTSDGEVKKLFTHFRANPQYIDLMEIPLKEGRMLTYEMRSDLKKGVLVNQKLVEELAWGENALGQKIGFMDEDSLEYAQVVGVIENFHVASLYSRMKPLAIRLAPKAGEGIGNIVFRIQDNQIKEAKRAIENVWNQHEKKFPPQYYFLDEQIAQYYKEDQKMGQIFLGFSILTIFIACLGLFGLASFAVDQRTKEIGIRKVLGASFGQIVKLLSSEIVVLVLIASALASPLAYYLSQKWLESFAYRIPISWFTYAWIGLLIWSIAMFTISYHALRATRLNPADILRDE